MIPIDLITGFLGSGKTTFIRAYADYLWKQGERVCILENDHGAINVDRLLLSDMKRDGLDIEMVAGGFDYDCHKRRLKTKLITLAMLGYTRVILEPSGVFDVDEFFDLLYEEPLDRQYQIANVITVVRADLEKNLSGQARYLLGSQAAQAGCLVFSHVQECEDVRLQETLEQVHQAFDQIKCSRQISREEIVWKDWRCLTEEELERIKHAGYKKCSFVKNFSMDQNSFQNLFFMELALSKEEMCSKIRDLFRDATAGNVIRVKGFAKGENGTGEGIWYEVNATREKLQTERISLGQDVLIVIGEDLNAQIIEKYFPSRYSTKRVKDEEQGQELILQK